MREVFLCLCVANPYLVALTASERREIITKRTRLATVSCQDHCLSTSKEKSFVGVVLEARLFTPVLKQQHSMNGPDIRVLSFSGHSVSREPSGLKTGRVQIDCRAPVPASPRQAGSPYSHMACEDIKDQSMRSTSLIYHAASTENASVATE
ncbi:hypothetical protein BKA59DRAFT_95292 [Fusarium tricinctum]|uniref:Uncharacterized protein n=1 Tax=Fusarium tricinctum TaxID=61284 RepID=A0A8K0S4D4_9HYPO|nr:hypothetical protein BKA59DRAFT_95292 [Fusarium tricinctum]